MSIFKSRKKKKSLGSKLNKLISKPLDVINLKDLPSKSLLNAKKSVSDFYDNYKKIKEREKIKKEKQRKIEEKRELDREKKQLKKDRILKLKEEKKQIIAQKNY